MVEDIRRGDVNVAEAGQSEEATGEHRRKKRRHAGEGGGVRAGKEKACADGVVDAVHAGSVQNY